MLVRALEDETEATSAELEVVEISPPSSHAILTTPVQIQLGHFDRGSSLAPFRKPGANACVDDGQDVVQNRGVGGMDHPVPGIGRRSRQGRKEG